MLLSPYCRMRKGLKKAKFKPAVLVNEVKTNDPSKNRQGLVRIVRSQGVEEDEVRFKHLCGLSSQGEMGVLGWRISSAMGKNS